MPNWCEGSITTDSAEIAGRIREIAEDGGRGVMGRFIPMPEPLRSIITGGRTIGGEYVSAWRGEGDDAVAVSAEEKAALREEHGADNWYDWNLHNYGCKWDFDLSGEPDYTDGGVRISYQTPWGPPTEFVEALSQQYPEYPITVAYAECGVGYMGRVTYLDGSLVDEWQYEGDLFREGVPDDEWDDLDVMDRVKPEVADFIQQHGLHGVGG